MNTKYSVYLIIRYKLDYSVTIFASDLMLHEAIFEAKKIQRSYIYHHHLETFGDYAFIQEKYKGDPNMLSEKVRSEFKHRLKRPLNGDLELSGIYLNKNIDLII